MRIVLSVNEEVVLWVQEFVMKWPDGNKLMA